MLPLRLLFTLFLFVSAHSAIACSCGSAGEFLTVAPRSGFVALVKVTKYTSFKSIYDKQIPMSMEVEVIDVYKGVETRKTITVWGDNGWLCRPYLSQFDTGRYYVIAFHQASDGSKGYVHTNEKPTDYAISICGDYWLSADTDRQKAAGAVTNKQREIDLCDLKARLASK